MYTYDFVGGKKRKVFAGPFGGYEEWEGQNPSFENAFFENDPDASRFSGPSGIDLYLWDFDRETELAFSVFRRNDNFHLANPKISPNGKWVAIDADSNDRMPEEKSTPGYAVGIVLVDFEKWLAKPQTFQ